MKKTIITLCLMGIAQLTIAQYQIGLVPRISPDKAIYQKIGFTEIEIKYGSPATKGRKLWGDLVPYGKVWRAGANNATTIELSDDIMINNQVLEAGIYALFFLPRENDKWTLIFNKEHEQWGAFRYKEEQDVLRVNFLPRRTNYPRENLTYSIQQLGYQYGSLVLNWEFMELEIPFETNYLKQFEKEVIDRAQQQPNNLKWIVFLQGAEHLHQIGAKEELANTWINQAEDLMDATTEWNENFYPKDYIKGHLFWIKAQLLAKNKNYPEAIAYLQKLKSLDNLMYYQRQNEREGIDLALASWNKQ